MKYNGNLTVAIFLQVMFFALIGIVAVLGFILGRVERDSFRLWCGYERNGYYQLDENGIGVCIELDEVIRK